MFYYKEGLEKKSNSRANELKEANKIIQDAINNSLRAMAEELKNSDLSLDEQNKILKDVKKQAQIEAIKSFTEKVQKSAQAKTVP